VKRPRIDEEAFVASWREVHKNNGSVQDVAAALGCSLGGVYVKAKSLRDDGVPLPELSSGRRRKRDVSRLTEILKGK
jgi:biotin operon repressor